MEFTVWNPQRNFFQNNSQQVLLSGDNIKTSEIINRSRKQTPEVLCKKGVHKFLKILKFQKFAGKHLCWSLFLIKLLPATLLKRDSNTDVSFKICKIFKSIYFEEHLLTAVSAVPRENCKVLSSASLGNQRFFSSSGSGELKIIVT